MVYYISMACNWKSVVGVGLAIVAGCSFDVAAESDKGTCAAQLAKAGPVIDSELQLDERHSRVTYKAATFSRFRPNNLRY